MKKILTISLIFFSLYSNGQDTIRIKLTGNNGVSSSFWTPSGNNIYYNNLIGNVGIGTANVADPNFRLFVETGIRTRKIKVDQTNWPDYVFDKNYQLPSLKDLETFIKQNNHLPDIPSAGEVQKNGIDLGENQAILLKKIEELTLYVIEQNKRIEEQSKKIAELEINLKTKKQ
jgi:hypothetical protein